MGVNKLIDYEKILRENPNGVLSTEDQGHPRARMFRFLFADGKKIYFCTSSEKSVFSQIRKNPNLSFCTWSKDYTPVLSVNGKATFTEDKTLKRRVLEENPDIELMYGSSENPIFKVFYIDIEEMATFSLLEGLKRHKL